MSPSVRIGVLGGTFDPVHCGHVHVADRVARQLGLARVILVPAGAPWMKQAPQAGGQDRLAMVELAIAGDDRLACSRVDLDRPGPTYAVDTLSDLARDHEREHPGQPVQWSFIVGSDALADFMHWRSPERILELADVIGVARPGHAVTALPIPADRLTLLEVDALEVSSRQIRKLVQAGASIEGLVPGAVADYIQDHGLYREAPA